MTVHEMYPYLCVKNAMEAIDFYTHVFQPAEKFRLTEPNGRFGHAVLDFNETTLVLSDEFPEYDIKGPHALGGTPVTIHLHVGKADAIIRGAAQIGATIDMEPQNQVYDERSGTFRHHFGHRWNIGHSLEELSPDEMQKRYTKVMTGE